MKNKWKSTIAVALSAVLSVAATGITASAETSNTELSVVTFDYATKTENTAILDVDALHQKNQKKISDLKLSEETINEAYDPVSGSSEISPLLGGDSPDSIIGTDDQVQVNPNQFPYCAVLALRLGRDTNGDGVSDTWYLGTGYLEGHDTMATAGHNFWTGSDWINECRVYVRQNSSTYGNTYYYPASWICSTAYTSNSSDSYNYDWCVVTLQNNLGGSNGWFGKGTSSGSLVGKYVYIAGYPAETASKVGKQYVDSGYITYSDDYRIGYSIDTEGGNSGSPVYDSDYISWGIHTSGGTTSNYGVRFTSALYEILQNNYLEGLERWT